MEDFQRECESGRFWEIRPGDSLYVVAREIGATEDEILRLNPGIDPMNLRIGDMLCLPQPPGIPVGPIPPCDSGLYWVVAPGDTLFTVAKSLSISVEQLLDLNPTVDPLNLQPGMSLCLPKTF